MAGKLVNKTELAAIFGKSLKTISIWQDEGMPFAAAESDGRANEYNTEKVIEWYVRRQNKTGPDVNEERAKLAAAQTEAARLRNDRTRGTVIDMETARTVVERAATAIRQKIVNSSMVLEEKQALLADIHGLRNVDFSADLDDDGESENGGE